MNEIDEFWFLVVKQILMNVHRRDVPMVDVGEVSTIFD